LEFVGLQKNGTRNWEKNSFFRLFLSSLKHCSKCVYYALWVSIITYSKEQSMRNLEKLSY